MRELAPRLALAAAGLLAIVAPLPLGGTSGAARAGLGLAVGLALFLLLPALRGGTTAPPRFALLALLTALLLGLYLVPWPAGIVETLSPRLAAEARASLALEGADPALAALDAELATRAGGEPALPGGRSLAADPDAARGGILRHLALIGAFLLGLMACRQPGDRRLLAGAVGLSAILQAALGLVEHFVGDGQLPGLAHGYAQGVPTGTFVNPNHYAALLSLGLFALIALVVGGEARPRAPEERLDARTRALLLVFFAALVALTLFWTASRGALAGAAFGIFVAGVALALTGHGGRRRVVTLALLGALAAALVAGSFLLRPPERLLEDVEGERITASFEGRTVIWGLALDAAEDFGLVGVGPGGYRHVEPLYRPPEIAVRAIHVHNDYLEWFVETGPLGALLLAGWIIAFFASALGLVRRGSERGFTALLLGGIAALAAHETFEFSLQLPGVAIPAGLLAGALLAAHGRGPADAPAAPSRPGLFGAALVLAGLLLVGLALAEFASGRTMRDAEALRAEARREAADVLEEAAAGELGEEEARRRLSRAYLAGREAAERAPLRPEVQLSRWVTAQALGATELARFFLLRAEELAPASRARHLLLARYWLSAGDPQQAQRVVRELLEMSPRHAREAYEVLGGAELGLADLMDATPNRPGAAAELARYLIRREDLVGAGIVLGRAASRHPEDSELARLEAQVALRRGQPEAAFAALERVELPAEEAGAREHLRLLADALVRLERFDELEEVAARQVVLGEDPYRLDMQRALVLERRGERSEAEALLRDALARRSPSPTPQQRLHLLLTLGRLLESEGRYQDALRVFSDAKELAPEDRRVRAFFERLERRTSS